MVNQAKILQIEQDFYMSFTFSDEVFNHYAVEILCLAVAGHWWFLRIAKKYSDLRLGPISGWIALGIVLLIGKELIDMLVNNSGANNGALLRVNQLLLGYCIVIVTAFISLGVFLLVMKFKK
jgi:hypothetical protein